MVDGNPYDELEGEFTRAWHARYGERSVDVRGLTRKAMSLTPPTGNQLQLADTLGIDISGISRERISTRGLRQKFLGRELAKRGMTRGMQVERKGRIRTIREIDLEDGFVILSSENRDVLSRVKIPNLLKRYKLFVPPPEAA